MRLHANAFESDDEDDSEYNPARERRHLCRISVAPCADLELRRADPEEASQGGREIRGGS